MRHIVQGKLPQESAAKKSFFIRTSARTRNSPFTARAPLFLLLRRILSKKPVVNITNHESCCKEWVLICGLGLSLGGGYPHDCKLKSTHHRHHQQHSLTFASQGSVVSVLQAQQAPKEEKGALMHRHKSLGLLAGMVVARE